MQAVKLLFLILVLNAYAGVKGEVTPTDYKMPDGTKVTFGNVSTLIDSGINDVTDLQIDQYIPGNLLAVDFSTLRTVNSSGATIVVGDGTYNDYVNGYGTAARVSYPAVYQLTPEILLLAEYFNHCVRLLNRTDNNYVTDFVGSCTSAGYVDGVGTAARLQYPTRLLGHPDDPNLVFVSEDSGNIRLINVTSEFVTTYLRSAFPSISSILWDPYYCNVLLLTSESSFSRLQIDTFTLTTYGNASGYVDGSLHLAQFQYLYDAKALYKDLYAVVDYADHRVRILDTASCTTTSICSGGNTTTNGPKDQCSIYKPSSLLFTSEVLYIGGNGYIKKLPVSIDMIGSSATTTPASSCAPISTESTRNESAFIDEASCQQLPSTTTLSTQPTTSGILRSAEYVCAVGTPNGYTSNTCNKGCFGLYKNGESNIGCMEDLNLADNGFGSTSTCGTDEMDGKCEFFASGDGEVERCIRCCTSGDNCNTVYKERCDYVPTDDKCSSCASRVNNVLVLIFLMVVPFIIQ